MVEPFLFGIILSMISISLLGLFSIAFLRYKNTNNLLIDIT